MVHLLDGRFLEAGFCINMHHTQRAHLGREWTHCGQHLDETDSEDNLEQERCGTQEECDAVMLDEDVVELEDGGWGTGAIIAMVALAIFFCMCCLELRFNVIGCCRDRRREKQQDD